jgi:AcrR family transcriptional regulator
MRARAASTAATRRSIADAWLSVFTEVHYGEITLELVAARAGVSVQTVIRHFGSKDELFVAVVRAVAADEAARRAGTPVGDTATAIRALVGDYERIGEVILRLLAQEDRLPELRAAADTGRRIHQEWVERVFAPHLDGLPPAERARRRGQLVALTDILLWKVLRHDQGFGRRRSEVAITEMVVALLNAES